MSYLIKLKNQIQDLINKGVIFKIGLIDIKPRNNDLPNHYIKKDGLNGTLDDSRMNTILNANDTFNHDHALCKNKIIISKEKYHQGHRIKIDFFCKRSRFIIEKLKNGTFILVTAYKLREYQMKKEKLDSFSSEICNEISDINDFLNML